MIVERIHAICQQALDGLGEMKSRKGGVPLSVRSTVDRAFSSLAATVARCEVVEEKAAREASSKSE